MIVNIKKVHVKSKKASTEKIKKKTQICQTLGFKNVCTHLLANTQRPATNKILHEQS